MRIVGFPRFVIVILLAGFAGLVFGVLLNPTPVREVRLPSIYRLPKVHDAASLRLAMIHDVLHERYLRHGAAWYEARNERARSLIAAGDEAIAAGRPAPPGYDDAFDDLAVGLDRLGHPDQAVPIMRAHLAATRPVPAEANPNDAPLPAEFKTERRGEFTGTSFDREFDLAEMEAMTATHLDDASRHRYAAWANLGTFLVHASVSGALRGDATAQAQLAEGLQAIRTAMRINPGAHFGRETWQAVAVEHLLAACADHDIAMNFTLIGDPVAPPPPRTRAVSIYVEAFGTHFDNESISLEKRAQLRAWIRRVGICDDWRAATHAVEFGPKPFDEAALGLIGMWTLGGGPNPHSALALAVIMEDIGQRRIAWNAYERAIELRDRWFPDSGVTEHLVQFARERQKVIEAAIAQTEHREAHTISDDLRSKHRSELAWGEAYQRDFQAFESAELAQGHDLSSEHAYDAFFRGRPQIATPLLPEDDTFAPSRRFTVTWADVLASVLIAMGLAAFVAAITDKRRVADAPRVPRRIRHRGASQSSSILAPKDSTMTPGNPHQEKADGPNL